MSQRECIGKQGQRVAVATSRLAEATQGEPCECLHFGGKDRITSDYLCEPDPVTGQGPLTCVTPPANRARLIYLDGVAEGSR